MKTLLLVFFAFALQAPIVPIAPGPRASIEGVVLSSEGRPVAGAEVRASWSPRPQQGYTPDQVPRTISDKDGKFFLRELGAGGYRLRVTAGGYAWQEYGAPIPGQPGAEQGIVLTLTPGELLQGITIHLVGEGVVSGRITSTNGSPLLGMDVHAFRKVFDAQGWATLIPVGKSGKSDDRGEYRITGLPEGGYYILATSPFEPFATLSQDIARMEGRAVPAAPSPGEFGSLYFPGSAESSKASMVKVDVGAESKNIDIALQRQQHYRIRGRVVDPASTEPPDRVFLGSMPARAEFVNGIRSSIAPYRPDGTFELTDITPGIYWINAQLPAPPMTPEMRQLQATPGADLRAITRPRDGGNTLVTVIDSDVSNVEVTIVRDFTLNGSVRVEGRSLSAEEIGAMQVELRPILLGRLNGPTGLMTMTPGGTFSYKNIATAEYRVTMAGLPADLYIKEGRLGGADVLDQVLLLIRQPMEPLDIVLAKGSEVRGSVTDAGSRPVPNQEVVLIPDRMPNRPDLYKTATTDANGRFTMQGVAPGDYKAFAWQTIEPFRYFDPEFLRGFEDRGSVVRVLETSRATVDVRLIP